MIPFRKASFVTPVVLCLCAPELGASSTASPAGVVRGPYLQSAAATEMTVVWQTDSPVSGALRFGRTPGPPWEFEMNGESGTTHAIQLNGLVPGTRYFYELAADGSTLLGGDDLHFRTYPPHKNRRPFRFVAWGDSGNGSSAQYELAAALDDMRPRPDLLLGLGDLVYETGEWEKYDPYFFIPYQDLLPNMILWPSIGNHDVMTEAGAPYFANFYLPTDTGAPGHPSGTENYYSFDFGMAHFVCLDTQISDIAVGGPMYDWLSDDLDDANARGLRWKFVFAHKPPYTKGSHDSDVEGDLIAIQDNLVPLIEAKGVDLFLAGHSHNYERSYLVAGEAILQGDPSEYTKLGASGTIYVVSGCGGKSGSGPFGHPLMSFALGGTYGHSVFDVSHDEVRAYFHDKGVDAVDLFTLRKAPDATPPRPIAAVPSGAASDELHVTFSEPVQAGAGTFGAENPANYALASGAPIVGATLHSDQRTVVLQTTSPPTGIAQILFVSSIADTAPAPNLSAPGSALSYVLPSSSGAPVAILTSDVHTANVPAVVTFEAGLSHDPDGTIVARVIDFGDGSTPSFGVDATHVYPLPGLYTASLIVTDDQGQQSIDEVSIHVHAVGSAPVGVITPSTTFIDPGETIDFDSAGSLDPDGGAVTLHWSFGDPASGADDHSTLPAPSHTFLDPGTFEVSLLVTDDEGSQRNVVVVIGVGEPPPPPSGGGGGSGGGGCYVSRSPGGGGDPSLLLMLAGLVAGLAWRARHRRRATAPSTA